MPYQSISEEELPNLVEGFDKSRGIFGAWPWDDRNVFPVLTVKIQVLEATQPHATGAGNDTLLTLRFHDVDRIEMKDFNHNNSIVRMTVAKAPRGHFTTSEELPPDLVVTFELVSASQLPFAADALKS